MRSPPPSESQGEKIKVFEKAQNGFKCILVRSKKYMEDDLTSPPFSVTKGLYYQVNHISDLSDL